MNADMRGKGTLMVRTQIGKAIVENGTKVLGKYKNKMTVWPQNPASHFLKR